MDDKSKINAIHNYIINNTAYDYDNYLNNTIPEESYTAYGSVILGRAVCQGYAEAFKQFMDVLGIKCYVVSGEAATASGLGGHAWNIVKVDGVYRHIDTTWDDPIYMNNGNRVEILRYDYFLLSDNQMNKDHNWQTKDYPGCN